MKKKQQKSKKNGKGGWLFLAIVLLIYGLASLIDVELVLQAMSSFVQMLDKVLPVLLIVFVLLFVINLLLEPERVNKYLGKESGIKGWLAAIIGGVLSTGPVYPWYALLGGFKGKGDEDIVSCCVPLQSCS